MSIVLHVLKQGIYIKRMCPNYICKFRNMNSHLLPAYLGVWAKIETVIKNMSVKLFVIVVIVLKPYTKYILFNAR